MSITNDPPARSERPRRGHLVQVRLSGAEWADLQEATEELELPSTSETLRYALGLLRREIKEIKMARSIRSFYGDSEPPPPITSVLVTDEDRAAADRSEW